MLGEVVVKVGLGTVPVPRVQRAEEGDLIPGRDESGFARGAGRPTTSRCSFDAVRPHATAETAGMDSTAMSHRHSLARAQRWRWCCNGVSRMRCVRKLSPNSSKADVVLLWVVLCAELGAGGVVSDSRLSGFLTSCWEHKKTKNELI